MLIYRAILLDVRTVDQYEKYHIKGSMNLPLYRPITGNDLATNFRRGVVGWVGSAGTGKFGL